MLASLLKGSERVKIFASVDVVEVKTRARSVTLDQELEHQRQLLTKDRNKAKYSWTRCLVSLVDTRVRAVSWSGTKELGRVPGDDVVFGSHVLTYGGWRAGDEEMGS